MKRTLLLIACMLASLAMPAQENSYFDYLPFVKEGKQWHVVRSEFDRGNHFEWYMFTNEEVTKGGKTYMKLYRTEDLLAVVYDAGLLREENRRVYYFDDVMQKEYLVFDYSLKAGDTFETYSYDDQKTVTYKVLSVGDYTEGPEIVRYDNNQLADSMDTRHRYLRQWTVCRTDDNSFQKTWIEGVGSLESPLANLSNARPVSVGSYLAYVEYNDFDYLPFSFYDTMNKQIHGSNLPTGKEYFGEDRHHHLTYELEGNRLHVYGKVFTQCGPNNYAYFTEEQTDDPLVRKLHFMIQEVEPLANCVALHFTNFYVPGFDPNMSYIIVDNQGEEHPVINKTPQMAYRPFIEDGKVWIVKVYPDGWGMVRNDEWTEYYYFDGDTIINGQKAKRMLCDRIATKGNTSGEYAGAWYEQEKKVYYAYNGSQQFKQLYDFTLSSHDSIPSLYGYMLAVKKLSGGIPGFKGVYYDFGVGRWLEGVGGESWPWVNHSLEFTGHNGTLLVCRIGDEVIYFNDAFKDDATPEATRKQRIDFTHTIKIRPRARTSRGTAQLPYGEYNDQQLDIHLDPLDEAYLVRIADETGRAVYEKAVDTGSIVALNIDISTFAKGRYTVTVENSQEAFTGEFEAQTTGIEEVRTKKPEVRGNVYNLQGQRISTLQKGLNLVEGRKIYVK